MRYLITFSYDGSAFSGYQKQPDKRSVQEEMEKVLTKINSNKNVSIVSSGRTDAGVHALSAKAHFDLDKPDNDLEKLRRSINSLLPRDIYVIDIKNVDDNFHARYNAIGKEYIYIINMGRYNPLERNYVLQYNKKLDLIAMERALKYLEGERSYKSFTKEDEEKDNYIRKISQTSLTRDSKNSQKIIISFVGTGFMRYMVRNMVGTILQIGEGKLRSEDIIDIIRSEDRSKAGITASPVGLYLKNVFY